MDRYCLVLNSLPPDPSPELLEQLRELGWVEGTLPMVLISGISDSEARIRKMDLEFLGVELEIVQNESVKETKPLLKQPELSLSDDDISFDELTLEIGETPIDFKTPPVEEALSVAPPAPTWELSLEEPSSPAVAPPVTPPVTLDTQNNKSEVPAFAFSLEEESEPPPAVPVAPTPIIELKSESLPSLNLEIAQEAVSLPSVEEVQPEQVKQIESPPVEVAVAEPILEPKDSSTNNPDPIESIEEENDDDEWFGVEEDESGSKVLAIAPKRKNIILGSGLVIIILLIGYIYLAPEPTPPEGASDNSGLVTALLSEQEKMLKEERKKELVSLSKVVEKPSDSISGKFPIQLSNEAIIGEIQFGRYQAGLLIDSLKLIEEQQQKLTPQELADGKTPRPWIKSFEVQLPPISSREPLGATYKFNSESRAYIEDSAGTLRIPCIIELDCEFKSGANLSCHYLIKNKALYKKPSDAKDEQNLANTKDPKVAELGMIKTTLTIERDDSLGYFVMISGDFIAKLHPQ